MRKEKKIIGVRVLVFGSLGYNIDFKLKKEKTKKKKENQEMKKRIKEKTNPIKTRG